MQCPHDDCVAPAKGCAEVRKLRQALKDGAEYHPPEGWGAKEPVASEAVIDPQALLDEAWKKLDKGSKPTQPTQPSMMIEELPRPNIQNTKLHHFNEAIKALEVLHDDVATLGPNISEMIVTLKRERASRYEYLIDWDAVARGGHT